MPRKIIILDRMNLPSDQDFRIAFWLDVPAARQQFYANSEAVSAVIGATSEELDAIKAGVVVEEIVTVPGRAGAGQAALLAAIVSRYQARQAEFTARNPWARYGSFWDGTGWTAVTVA
jgi:FAD/FMN-containing dehydrogenase